jgi:hypothetical protein
MHVSGHVAWAGKTAQSRPFAGYCKSSPNQTHLVRDALPETLSEGPYEHPVVP